MVDDNSGLTKPNIRAPTPGGLSGLLHELVLEANKT